MYRVHNWAWIALEFVPGDLWVGLFVTTKPTNYSFIGGNCTRDLHIFLCLIPCLPVHVIIPWEVKPHEGDKP